MGLISAFPDRDEGQKALEIKFSDNPDACPSGMESKEVKKPRTRVISRLNSTEIGNR
uniref:Uncharacterized protein n=1 Tax=Cucumis melo TaxID=3656 RepID=A0A9I9DCN3_CUCME